MKKDSTKDQWQSGQKHSLTWSLQMPKFIDSKEPCVSTVATPTSKLQLLNKASSCFSQEILKPLQTKLQAEDIFLNGLAHL